MPYKDKPIEKLYYSIGEVAEMFSVNTSLIRFWEKEFDVLKPKKNKKGNRLFTKKDLEYLKIIYLLVKEKGYTLDGAKKKIKQDKKELKSKQEVLNSLKSVRKNLEDLRNELSE